MLEYNDGIKKPNVYAEHNMFLHNLRNGIRKTDEEIIKIATDLYHIARQKKLDKNIGTNPKIKLYHNIKEYSDNNKEKTIDDSVFTDYLASDWCKDIKNDIIKKQKSGNSNDEPSDLIKGFYDYYNQLHYGLSLNDSLHVLRTSLNLGNTLPSYNETFLSSPFYWAFNLVSCYTKDPYYHLWMDFLKSGILGYKTTEDTIHIILTPDKIRLNAELEITSTDPKEPSIMWPDGTNDYFIENVPFEEKLWTDIVSGNMSIEDAVKLENIEQRGKAMKVIGIEKLLKPEYLIDVKYKNTFIPDKENPEETIPYRMKLELFNIPNLFFGRGGRSMTCKVAHYKDPSTDRWYTSFVDPNINDAIDAMAWKFGLTRDEYMNELLYES